MATDHVDDEPTHEDDSVWVAPGGWRRVVAGFAVGAAAGVVLGLILPRNDRADTR